MARIQLQKSILHLHRAPLVLTSVPALRTQASRSGDGPGVPGPVRQVGRKYFALIGCDKNVVGRGLLGKYRHLTLEQRHAAVGASRAAGILEDPFLNNLGAKARGGAT